MVSQPQTEAQLHPPAPSGAVAALLAEAKFGGPTTLKFTRVTVGTTNTTLLSGNPRRVFWLAVNVAVSQCAIWFDNSIAFATDVLLGAAGGYASMTVDEDGEAVTYPVQAVMSGASGTVDVIEVLRV